jgi:tetratricopeptide (TPR) repeat protein
VICHHVGLVDEAQRDFDRALVISPEHVVARQHQALCHYTRCRFEEALAIYADACARAPISWLHYRMALCQIQLGQLDDAARRVETMLLQQPGEVLAHPLRALLAALRGDAEGARREAQATTENERAFGHFHHAQYDLGCVFALLGEPDEALRWLRAAADNGFPCAPQYAGDPLLRSLRGDPRFAAFLNGLEDQQAAYRRLYDELRAASEPADSAGAA